MNPYDGNTAKKVVTFLKGWDVSVVPYAKSWKLSYFNRVNHETIRTLREELLTKLKKKAVKVCETQNVLSGHVIQKGNTNQSHKMDQIEGNRENLSRNIDDDRIQLNSMEFNRNQWMSIDINEDQLISIELNKNQLISTDINRF